MSDAEERFGWVKPVIYVATGVGAIAAAIGGYNASTERPALRPAGPSSSAALEERTRALETRVAELEAWRREHQVYSDRRSAEFEQRITAAAREAETLRQELETIRARQDRVVDQLRSIDRRNP